MKKNSIHYLSALHLVQEKEKDFMTNLKDMTLEELNEFFGIYTREINLALLDQCMHSVFSESLFQDDDFLNLNVVSHFKVADDFEIFGLTFLDAHECSECCSMITEWFALILDFRDGNYYLNRCACCDCLSVSNSEFRGKSLHNVFRYIKQHPRLDIFI